MLVFTTESGSIYELDHEGRRLRRLSGATPQTRVGPNGKWKEFLDISPVEEGKPVSIVWQWDDEGGLLVARSTVTSCVTSVTTITEANA